MKSAYFFLFMGFLLDCSCQLDQLDVIPGDGDLLLDAKNVAEEINGFTESDQTDLGSRLEDSNIYDINDTICQLVDQIQQAGKNHPGINGSMSEVSDILESVTKGGCPIGQNNKTADGPSSENPETTSEPSSVTPEETTTQPSTVSETPVEPSPPKLTDEQAVEDAVGTLSITEQIRIVDAINNTLNELEKEEDTGAEAEGDQNRSDPPSSSGSHAKEVPDDLFDDKAPTTVEEELGEALEVGQIADELDKLKELEKDFEKDPDMPPEDKGPTDRLSTNIADDILNKENEIIDAIEAGDGDRIDKVADELNDLIREAENTMDAVTGIDQEAVVNVFVNGSDKEIAKVIVEEDKKIQDAVKDGVKEEDILDQVAKGNSDILTAEGADDNTGKADDDNKLLGVVDVDISGFGCNCKDVACGCCFNIVLTWFGWSKRGCLLFYYTPGQFSLDIKATSDDKIIFARRFQIYNPLGVSTLLRQKGMKFDDSEQAVPPVHFCFSVTVPVPFLPITMDACPKIDDIHISNTKFNGCLGIQFDILRYSLLHQNFGCINMTLPPKRSIFIKKLLRHKETSRRASNDLNLINEKIIDTRGHPINLQLKLS